MSPEFEAPLPPPAPEVGDAPEPTDVVERWQEQTKWPDIPKLKVTAKTSDGQPVL